MKSPYAKISKEVDRLKKKVFKSQIDPKDIERLQHKVDNLPYEIFDKVHKGEFTLEIPTVKNATETVEKIIHDNCSLTRFGDGEFSIMNDGQIHFQKRSSPLAEKLKVVLTSDTPNLLIALPDCFGSLDDYTPQVADFWREWMAKKRTRIYSYLNMDRVYYSAFFTRAYLPYNKSEEQYQHCGEYFDSVKKIWSGRDVIICEGEGTRFGLFNDLLSRAKSVSRVLCPERNAYDKYEEIQSAFDNVETGTLVLTALGPTATALAYDLSRKGFQTIDIGHLDVEYEWYLRKDELGHPLEHKYVDGTKDGRKVHKLENAEYEAQIIKRVL